VFELVRDKDYWAADLPLRKGRFNFDRLEHVFYRDAQTSFQDFYTGRIHTQQEFSARRWKAENAMPAYASGDILRDDIPYKNSAFYMSITMNTRRPFLSDRRVRRAVQMAYDFEFAREIVLHGHHGRTNSYFANTEFEAAGLPSPGELRLLEPFRDRLPPEVFTHAPSVPVGGSRWNQRQNLKVARDLLTEAGYRVENMKLVDPATGEPVVLEFITFSPNVLNQASYFFQNLKRLGIEVQFRSFDASQFRLISGNYQFDLMLGSAAFGPQDAPGSELLTSWSSQAAEIPNQLNFAGIADPAIDHALDTIISANDHQTVVDAMRAIDRVARFNHYSIPMQHTYPAPVGQKPLAYWDRFGRPQKNDVTYIYPLMTLDHWWWDPEKEAQLSHGAFK
jgi:microcin C transport system substrate-binding protein